MIISDQTPWKNLRSYGVGFDIELDKKEEFIKAIKYYAQIEQNEFKNICDKLNIYLNDFIENNDDVKLTKNMFNNDL